MNGNAVMYDAVAGKILTVGGGANYDSSSTNANANIITLGLPNTRASVTTIGSAHYARAFHNSVVLPDGKVLFLGGVNFARVFSDDTTILYPELFDPATNSFTIMAPMSIPRNYHSVAILLADGTVFSAGGGLCGVGCTAKPLRCPNLPSTLPFQFRPDRGHETEGRKHQSRENCSPGFYNYRYDG